MLIKPLNDKQKLTFSYGQKGQEHHDGADDDSAAYHFDF